MARSSGDYINGLRLLQLPFFSNYKYSVLAFDSLLASDADIVYAFDQVTLSIGSFNLLASVIQ